MVEGCEDCHEAASVASAAYRMRLEEAAAEAVKNEVRLFYDDFTISPS